MKLTRILNLPEVLDSGRDGCTQCSNIRLFMETKFYTHYIGRDVIYCRSDIRDLIYLNFFFTVE